MGIPKQRLFIDDTAHLYCPVRGRDVDIELCLACPRLQDFDLDTRRPYLVCRVPETSDRGGVLARAIELA